MRHLLWSIVVAPVMILVMGACSHPEGEMADFKEISNDGWAYGDTIAFALPADTLPEARRLALAVRHSASYPYANLWVEVTVPAGDTAWVDTVNVRLADRYGRRLGRGAGVSFIKVDTLPSTYTLVDTASVFVRHVMRVDTLPDVEQIGILAL